MPWNGSTADPTRSRARRPGLLAQGETNGACDKLTEFLKEVARETGNSLTKEQAEELSTEAEQIKAVIGCP